MSLANRNDAYFGVTEAWQFQNLALQDLTDVIDDMDENNALRLLALIGNQARWIVQNGQHDIKLSFAKYVCELFRPHAQAWAEEKAELAADRGTP